MAHNVIKQEVNSVGYSDVKIREVYAEYPINSIHEHKTELRTIDGVFKESLVSVYQNVETALSNHDYNIDMKIQEHPIKLEPFSFNYNKETISKVSRGAADELLNNHLCSKHGLEDIREIHSEDKKSKNNQCGKRVIKKQSLINHQKIHTVEKKKPYQCSTCNKCFDTKPHLMTHQRIHTDEKPYQCSYCNKCFGDKYYLITHQRIHTGEKPYQCSYCNKCFASKPSFNMHQRVHTGDKPYQCSYCDKYFAEKSNMSKHIKIHTGEKSHTCSICERSFSSKQNLTSHLHTVHTDNMPYQCPHCAKCFKLKRHLESHVKLHSSLDETCVLKEQYQCNNCDNVYSKRHHLIRHQRLHTGEKPYLCDHCNRGFAYSKSDKEKHQQKCLGEKPVKQYQCNSCDKSFSMKFNLFKHQRRMHIGIINFNETTAEKKT